MTKKENKNTQNVPNLRFPEFNGEWEVKKLGSLCSKIGSGKTPKGGDSVYTLTGIPFIRSQNVINNSLLLDSTHIPYEVHKSMQISAVFSNDILLNITGGSIGRSCVVPQNFEEGNVNQHVSIIRLKKDNPKFLQVILSSWKGQKLVYEGQTGSGREGLNFESIKKFKISFPTISEQNKIANFLSLLDERIQTQNKIIDNLESLKVGFTQKIFSQQLRFKDDHGDDFPEWEKKELGEIFAAEKGSGLSKDDIEELGIYKCILYGELYTTYSEIINKVFNRTNKDGGRLSKMGDLLVPCSTTTKNLDLANVTSLKEENVRLGGDITILRSKRKVNSDFFAYYLTNFKKHDLAKYGQGTTIVHLYYSHFKVMKIDVPCIEEQTKIANFLSLLDQKIETEKALLARYKEQKQYFLQQLFT